MGRTQLRAMPLSHLKAYMSAYGLAAPPHAVEKDEFVRAVLGAREANGCLPKVNEDYYRRNSIPKPSGERPRGFLARMADGFADLADLLPQPDANPPQLPPRPNPPRVPPRHSRPQQPPATTPRPQAGVNTGSTGFGPQRQPPRTAPRPANPSPYSATPPSTQSRPETQPPTSHTQSRPQNQPPPPASSRSTAQPILIEQLLEMGSEDISKLSIGVLKATLQQNHVRIPQDALEKRDLVEKVVTLAESARAEKERDARARAAEEEAEIEAQRHAFEELEKAKDGAPNAENFRASDEKPAEGSSEPHSDLPKAARPAAAKLQRDGLCVICQDEDANIAIVDCGRLPPSVSSPTNMASFKPFGQLEYQPVQIALPQLQYSQFPTPPQQQPPPSHSHSPHPTGQQEYQSQPPQPVIHAPRTAGYSSDPFEWILSNITTLMNTQHNQVTTKLDELASQQNALSSKLETLQQATNARQTDITAINSSLQTVTVEVARLGKDMASRDAMLAERLGALDDAIDPDGRFFSTDGVEPEALQAPPTSDVQLAKARIQQPEPEPDFQAAVPASAIASAPVIAPRPAEDTNVGTRAPAPPTNGSSSTLSSPEPSQRSPSGVETNGEVPSSPKIVNQALQRVKQQEPSPAGSPVRRSGRALKKRQPIDAATNVPTLSKKRKSTASDAITKTPAKKKMVTKKPAGSTFEWSTVPFRQERDLQDPLIQCESCDVWYHWACVNIDPEDPLLHDEDTPWACPPCVFEASQTGTHKLRPRGSLRTTRCRPDCVNADEPEEKFMIDSIVGRFPHLPDKTGKTMLYLIKWEDYGLAAATWTPEPEIGHSAPVLIQRFETVAREEGHNIFDRQALILLNEATDAGWGYNQAPPI
ncbi:hypothetical protein FRC07_013902 [Ceratobasidium sp. 392]|nr:hypothetical protein FRC07_013902 [Ceratobasidium sp. 392]